MSFEKFEKKPSTKPTPVQKEAPEALTPDKTKSAKEGKNVEEEIKVKSGENTAPALSPEDKSFIGETPEKPEKRVIYKGLYKIPGINRVIGKLEIAHNKSCIKKHQEKINRLKAEISELNSKISDLNRSGKEVESIIEKLREGNVPNDESLQLKAQEIKDRKKKLLKRRDKLELKVKAREDKIKSHARERNRIADEFIKRYEEKLKPIETELENLRFLRDRIDLLIALAESEHKKMLAAIDNIERKKSQIEEALRKTGMPDRKIKRFDAVKKLKNIISKSRKKITEQIRKEKEYLLGRKKRIEEEIAKADLRAKPHRDKRKEFVRAKSIRVGAETKQKKEAVSPRKMKKSRRIKTSRVEEMNARTFKLWSKGKEISGKQLQVSRLLDIWNAFAKKRRIDQDIWNPFVGKKRRVNQFAIDRKDFLETTHLSENYELDPEDFKKILERYLKLKGLPAEKFSEAINAFFWENTRVKK
ncbi:MAG TPA: hypothetical protein ENL27_02965 [Candidatus Parcubacteria bacterium]|nr:hypothetical protein [Candidatus Parcubacteria bacterium]